MRGWKLSLNLQTHGGNAVWRVRIQVVLHSYRIMLVRSLDRLPLSSPLNVLFLYSWVSSIYINSLSITSRQRYNRFTQSPRHVPHARPLCICTLQSWCDVWYGSARDLNVRDKSNAHSVWVIIRTMSSLITQKYAFKPSIITLYILADLNRFVMVPWYILLLVMTHA